MIFESLDAFRARCGEPTMPIEQCSICSKIPATCSREVEDYRVVDDRPSESLEPLTQLEKLVEGRLDGDVLYGVRGEILRCPTCHRLYSSEVTFTGAWDYQASWKRYDVDALFNVEWCVAQRLPDHRVYSVCHGLFPNHALVWLGGAVTWNVLDGNNRLSSLDSGAALAVLIDRDPPRVTGDLDLAKRYAFIVDQIENPDDKRLDDFGSIDWRQPLTPEEQQQVDAAQGASRVEAPVAEREGEHVIVRYWVTSRKRLICRVITVRPDGHYLREDAVIAENLPIAARADSIFESLDAFRAHCGEPTMPLEQCPICSKLPEHCHKDGDREPPPEIERLEHFIQQDVRRCPTCCRLYFYESISFGNDIYTGNDNTWRLDRCTADVLFDMEWCVRQRLPDREVRWIGPDRFFPGHVLVDFGSKSWGALDITNRLVMLDGHDAIVKLIDSDPPRVTHDVELAKRYATFIDEREYPDDTRATTDLVGMLAREDLADMHAVAERAGDRVIVRSWVTSQKRLVRRVITVQPNGHLIREDTIIAEDLPIR